MDLFEFFTQLSSAFRIPDMGEEIAFESLTRSTSPPLMDDYRKKAIAAVADYTTNNGDGPDPVLVMSYRSVEHKPIECIRGLVPKTTGYVNGGPSSINFRSKQDSPRDEVDGLGVGEVDFDTKCTDAYANLDDVRDRHYHLARSVSSESPERAIYKGVPNYSKEKNKKAKISCCLVSFLVFIFSFQLLLLALGVFNLVNGLEVGMLTKSIFTSPSASTSAMVEQLRQQVDELQHNLSMYNTTHGTDIGSISAQIITLSSAVNNLTVTPSPKQVNISVKEGCTTDKVSCRTDPASGSMPMFQSCITPTYQHITNASTYLADIYCTVDDSDQVMPIASTLTFVNGVWSCRCHGIKIPHSIQQTLMQFACFLNYVECPKTIPVPLQ